MSDLKQQEINALVDKYYAALGKSHLCSRQPALDKSTSDTTEFTSCRQIPNPDYQISKSASTANEASSHWFSTLSNTKYPHQEISSSTSSVGFDFNYEFSQSGRFLKS